MSLFGLLPCLTVAIALGLELTTSCEPPPPLAALHACSSLREQDQCTYTLEQGSVEGICGACEGACHPADKAELICHSTQSNATSTEEHDSQQQAHHKPADVPDQEDGLPLGALIAGGLVWFMGVAGAAYWKFSKGKTKHAAEQPAPISLPVVQSNSSEKQLDVETVRVAAKNKENDVEVEGRLQQQFEERIKEMELRHEQQQQHMMERFGQMLDQQASTPAADGDDRV